MTRLSFDCPCERVQTRTLRCDYCDHGCVDGPYTAPDYCSSVPCNGCDGTGWVDIDFVLIDEDDLADMEAGQPEEAA